MKKTNNKGFSLVELIVVIAIMAVLIAVLAPTFTKYVERGRKSTDVQNVAAIITAVQTYAADPMVETADMLSTGTITLTTTDTAVAGGTGGNCTGNLNLALVDAGIDEIGLSSARWGATTIVLDFTINTDGSIDVGTSTSLAANHDILEGEYE